jgi:hypothetical protein
MTSNPKRPPWWFAPAVVLGSILAGAVILALTEPFMH